MEDEQIEARDATPGKLRRPRPIETVHHMHGMGHEAFVRMHLPARIRRGHVTEEVYEGLALEPCDLAVQVRVDHGRWLVDCPFCPGSEMFDPEDLRFFCLSCYNAKADGRWLRVIAPEAEEHAAIDRALQERPEERFKHWRPGMTVADLQIQNTNHDHW